MGAALQQLVLKIPQSTNPPPTSILPFQLPQWRCNRHAQSHGESRNVRGAAVQHGGPPNKQSKHGDRWGQNGDSMGTPNQLGSKDVPKKALVTKHLVKLRRILGEMHDYAKRKKQSNKEKNWRSQKKAAEPNIHIGDYVLAAGCDRPQV